MEEESKAEYWVEAARSWAKGRCLWRRRGAEYGDCLSVLTTGMQYDVMTDLTSCSEAVLDMLTGFV